MLKHWVRINAFLLGAALAAQESTALRSLALGNKAIQEQHYAEALTHLEAARGATALADYVGYLTAAARFESGNYAQVEAALHPVWNRTPASPLAAKAAILLANALLRSNEPARVAGVVRQHAGILKPPEVESLLAHAAEAQGDQAAALGHFQRILIENPLAPEAADAEADPTHLASLPPQAHLARCMKLLDGDAAKARRELEPLLPSHSGNDLDRARVKLGVVRYQLRDSAGAYQWLSSFQSASPELEAERLYTLIRCVRRLDRAQDFGPNLDSLAAGHARSGW